MTGGEPDAPDLHPLAGGGHVAYRFLPGRAPTVVFLCGYASEMTGTKARFLHRVCADAGHAYLRFDYRGRGASSGRFEEGTIGSWTDDACAVIEAAVRGPVVFVGVGRGGGGWGCRCRGGYGGEPYPVTLRLVEDARERLQLRDRIPLDCPVRLIHGYRDEDVPWQTSFRLASRLRSSDVKVEIVGDGEHRLSRDADLARLARTLHGVLGARGT